MSVIHNIKVHIIPVFVTADVQLWKYVLCVVSLSISNFVCQLG